MVWARIVTNLDETFTVCVMSPKNKLFVEHFVENKIIKIEKWRNNKYSRKVS